MRFDLVDLRLFLNVAETASITHGAAKANMALASASARIRGMEATLGVDLLERERRGVRLTPAGRALARHAQVVLQHVATMRGDLSNYAGGQKGHVRLLANASALSELLPERLGAFLAEHRGVDIDVEEKSSYDIVRNVAEGFADIGIVADIVDFGSLEVFPFGKDRLVAVMPPGHAFAGQKRLSFFDLLDQDFVGMGAINALQQHLGQHAMQAGRPLKLRVRLASYDAVCRMVENGIGLAIIPETAAKRCRATMKIRITHLIDPWTRRHLHVCVRRFDELTAHARQLVAHLRSGE